MHSSASTSFIFHSNNRSNWLWTLNVYPFSSSSFAYCCDVRKTRCTMMAQKRYISHLESLMMLFLLHFSLSFFETFEILCWGGKWHLIIIRGAVNPSKCSRQWTTRDTPNFLCRSVPSSDSFLFLWFVSQKSKRIRSKTISDHCFYSLSHTFPHSHRSRLASCRAEQECEWSFKFVSLCVSVECRIIVRETQPAKNEKEK